MISLIETSLITSDRKVLKADLLNSNTMLDETLWLRSEKLPLSSFATSFEILSAILVGSVLNSYIIKAIISGANIHPILIPANFAPINEIMIAIIFAAIIFLAMVAIIVFIAVLANTFAMTPFKAIVIFFAKSIAVDFDIGIETALATTFVHVVVTAFDEAVTILSPIESSIL